MHMSLRKKLNCWEFKECGRQPGGILEKKLGTCPVTLNEELDGIHEGTHAGRACWAVAGTFCNGEVQGTFAQKFGNCEDCDFYRTVKNEEFPHFTLSMVLLSKIKKK